MPDGAVDAELKIGDVAHDLVKRGKVQVVGIAASSVNAHQDREDYDIAAYKANALLDVQPEETVYSVVYLPDEPQVSFSGTYDFPESRLARIPTEAANEELRRVQYDLTVNAFGTVFEAVAHVHDDGHEAAGVIADYLIERGFPEEIVDEALELAEVDQVIGGDGGGE